MYLVVLLVSVKACGLQTAPDPTGQAPANLAVPGASVKDGDKESPSTGVCRGPKVTALALSPALRFHNLMQVRGLTCAEFLLHVGGCHEGVGTPSRRAQEGSVPHESISESKLSFERLSDQKIPQKGLCSSEIHVE